MVGLGGLALQTSTLTEKRFLIPINCLLINPDLELLQGNLNKLKPH
jgi:hypothetical protein